MRSADEQPTDSFVVNFGHYSEVLKVTWLSRSETMVVGALEMLVQCFLALRGFKVGSCRRNRAADAHRADVRLLRTSAAGRPASSVLSPSL